MSIDGVLKGGRPLWSLSGSLLLHGLALAAAVALATREVPPSAIIVELEDAIRVGEPAAPAAPGHAESPPAAVRGRPRPPVRPAAPIAAGPSVPAPPARVEPAPAPSELPAPASAAGAGSTVAAVRPPSGFSTGAAGAVQELAPAGSLGAGPLVMLAPSARAGVAAGPGGGDGQVPTGFGPYLVALRQRIQESLNYPLVARRRGLGGIVQLEVELLPNGKVASVVVRSSSSHAVLDQAALDTVSQLSAAPFPPGVPSRPLKVRVPIVFELR